MLWNARVHLTKGQESTHVIEQRLSLSLILINFNLILINLQISSKQDNRMSNSKLKIIIIIIICRLLLLLLHVGGYRERSLDIEKEKFRSAYETSDEIIDVSPNVPFIISFIKQRN